MKNILTTLYDNKSRITKRGTAKSEICIQFHVKKISNVLNLFACLEKCSVKLHSAVASIITGLFRIRCVDVKHRGK